MANTKSTELKFTVDYYTEDGQLDSRWHYDYEMTRNGPILVENFILPEEQSQKTKKKKDKL